jgi:hypothetical protein
MLEVAHRSLRNDLPHLPHLLSPHECSFLRHLPLSYWCILLPRSRLLVLGSLLRE